MAQLKSLKALKKESPENAPENAGTNGSNGSEAPQKLSALKDAKAEGTEKKERSSFGKEQMDKYIEILSDGKPHKIQDLLKTFGLPNSTSGREKFRNANSKINASGEYVVTGEYISGEGKHFKMTPVAK